MIATVEASSEPILEAISQVKLEVKEGALHLIAPGKAHKLPKSDFAQNFAELPVDFAKAYLQLELRDFLYATFCLCSPANESDRQPSHPSQNLFEPIANDSVGGGIHVGLLNQFLQNNVGQGYFDPGWQVVKASDSNDEEMAVVKHGVVLQIERSRYLAPEQKAAKIEDSVAIRLPGYRFEPDCYIAIGNSGPVREIATAVEIYFAANAAAMAPILLQVSQALNKPTAATPYTLRIPYRIEDYAGAETIALRVEARAYEIVMPLLKEISQQCPVASFDRPNDLDDTQELDRPPTLRSELPVFAYPLFPGISAAAVIESNVTDWFGSWADLSRCDVLAAALVAVWERHSSAFAGAEKNLSGMRSHTAAQGLCWPLLYRRSERRPNAASWRQWFCDPLPFWPQ